jgi:hypothetical protein
MTTGRINQIAIPTDPSASEKRSSQPRPTDADPEISSGLEPPSRRFLSIAECACYSFTLVEPSSDSDGRDSSDCSDERPHRRRSRVQGTTFAINYEA